MFEWKGDCTPDLGHPSRRQSEGGIVAAMPWRPGDAIVLREMWRGRVFEARPATVVEDTSGQTMLFVRAGALVAIAVDDKGRQLRLPEGSWHLELHEVRAFSILSFAWPEIPYSVLFLREPDGRPRGWYVNLQDPLERTPLGFDTVDHALDVVVSTDRTSWSWKDEDELEHAVSQGLFTEANAAEFRRWGEIAVRRLVDREPPFDEPWEDWEPDPSWPAPQRPEGWDRVGP
jgi:predicted RNA-binding protein associated with RNAse of E/G family